MSSYKTTILLVRHESTGYSPHFLMFGWHPRLAIDAFLGVTSDSPVKDHISWFTSERSHKLCKFPPTYKVQQWS
jgi:hypothetical protein